MVLNLKKTVNVLACAAMSALLSGCGYYSDLSRVEDVSRERVKRITDILAETVNRENTRYGMTEVIFYAFANNAELTLLQSQLDTNASRRLTLLLSDLPTVDGTWGSTMRSRPSPREDEHKHTQKTNVAIKIDAARLFLNQAEKLRTEADRKVLNLRLRNSFNNLAMEAMANYAFIVNAQQIKRNVRQQLRALQDAKKKSALLADALLQDPLISLSYRNGIQTLADSLRKLEAQVRQAELALFSSLSYQFGGQLDVRDVNSSAFIRAVGGLERDDIIIHALSYRSDLKVGDYNVYKTELDLESAALNFLPAISLDSVLNVDSSRVPVDRRFLTAGLNISLPLLDLLTQPYVMERAEQQKLQAQLQAIARNLAVVAEIDLVQDRLREAVADLISANAMLKTRNEILSVRAGRAVQSEQDELDMIRVRAEAVEAGIRTLNAKTILFRVALQVYVAAGYDLFPDTFLNISPFDIAKSKDALLPSLEGHLSQIMAGALIAAPAPSETVQVGEQ